MALNKILSGMVENFKLKTMLPDLADDKAYEHLVNYTIISKYHPEAFSDPQFLEYVDVDDSSTFGLDGVAFIVNDNLVLSPDDIRDYVKSKSLDVKVLFIQTKTATSYDSGDFLKTVNAVKSFFGDRSLLPQNEALTNAFNILEELLKYENVKFFNRSSPQCYVYYVTAGKVCDDPLLLNLCNKQKNEISQTCEVVKEAEVLLCGADYIIDAYRELENRIEVVFNFKNSISLDKIEQVEQAYLGYIAANEYLKIIVDSQGDLRKRLFYENVRDYQGHDNPVNAEIRNTIDSPQMRDKFVLLNNGVTIVTKHFKSLGANQFEMTDFNIVNGCQTSTELYEKRDKSENVVLPLKVIHTIDSDLISQIVKATNRQTPVPDEAFIALKTYHKRLQEVFELYSRDMPLKLYYERRSGEFDFADSGLRHQQIATLHSLIRVITSVYFQDAYVVYNNNPANILRSRAERLFVSEHKYETYYLASYLFSKFTQLDSEHYFSRPSYKLRFYMAMLAKIFISGTTVIHPMNSVKCETDAKNAIGRLRAEEFEIKDVYKKSMTILQSSISQYQQSYRGVSIDRILRDPKFNKMVLDKAKALLTIRR